MTNVSTIEDVLENILGLVLGAAAGQYALATSGNGGGQGGSGKSSINKAFRPDTVKGSGPWLIAQSSTLTHTGGWAPEYDKDAVTFYRWKEGGFAKHITRLTVWVGVVNRDNAQKQEHNTTDPTQTVNGSANPVVALGSAWELVRNEVPNVAGPGTSFDPSSLEAARQVLENLNSHAMYISGGLEDDIKQVNTKTQDFKGSAESAWYHRVQVADHYLSDIKDQYPRWNTALSSASQAATNFINALNDAIHNWSQIQPAGTWQHPYRVIAAMFNESTLAYGDLHDGKSNAWDLGTQYANTGESYGNNEDGTEPETATVLWTPPSWLGYHSFDAFDINQWNLLDTHLRQKWADNVVNTFAPVLTAATNLVTAFADARNPLSISDPAPVPPLPMPNKAGMPNGLDNPFANIGNPFANIGNPFANIGNPFANMGNPFANMGNPFANMGSLFPNGGGFGAGNPFANGPEAGTTFTRLANPFASGGDGAPFTGGGFGAGDPFANGLEAGTLFSRSLNPLASGGDGDPFTGGGFGAGNPFANGPDAGTMFTRLADPFADSPQTLGELTPTQLQQLSSAGLLDDVPLTPEQANFLRQNGLGVPGGANPTLGQLTPDQLDALQQAGLLDQTPLTAAERANLGLPDTAALRERLAAMPTAPVDTSPFPTTVNGLDVSPDLQPAGLGMTLGDVSQPGAAAHPDIPGFLTGTGGLSSVPGVSGTSGALSPGGLGLGIGGSGAGGSAGGAGMVTGGGLGAGSGGGLGTGPGGLGAGLGGAGQAGGAGVPFGGMPYMPGMMGGGAGPSKQDERQRNTWLKEDEEVWGTDPACAPAVVGRRGRTTRVEDDEYPTFADERSTTQDERRLYRGR